jgi:hypothetical protein
MMVEEVRCLLRTAQERDQEQLEWHLTSLKQDVGPVRFNLICAVALLLWRMGLRPSP